MLRRDNYYRPEYRKGTVVRGLNPQGRTHREVPGSPTKPYVYGVSRPESRPEVPAGERPDQPSPEVAERAREQMRLQWRLRRLQQTYRPLTKAELLPGLWAELIVETPSGLYGRSGLLAVDRREPSRLLLWSLQTSETARAYFVLGPSDARDDSMPTHEVWPIDPEFLTESERELLHAFARQSAYNPDLGEYEVVA
ncbi:hypothetical protein ACF06W_11325 [Streptomyces albus]|uniref:hypothetical protein n=1 Tax=Streptomyces albus TaxID=1888 RepID=UPI0036F6D202